MPSPGLKEGKALVLASAALSMGLIAVLDRHFENDLPLGFLYLMPMLVVGKLLRPWQTAIVAALCTLLAELFDPFVWNLRTGASRDLLYFAAFLTVGIFTYSANRSRQLVTDQLQEIKRQSEGRLAAEEQLQLLVESSPAAIITADADGRVLMANEAAHRMLEVGKPLLLGRSIHDYFPALSNISRRETNQHLFRAVMQSRGRREKGDTFSADICFSTYKTAQGSRLAATILDASEELRTREESSLHQMMIGSRLAVGALSHEVRNICGAITVVHQNLARIDSLARNKDFEALGSLAVALERIASLELTDYSERTSAVDLTTVLNDIRIVITPSMRDEDIRCDWKISEDLPLVWADRTYLMQILLNLTNNSIRVLTERNADRQMSIEADCKGNQVTIQVIDNGGGVTNSADLFRPFQLGAQSTGLGLYLARAFARSFGGDLHYHPLPGKAFFLISLNAVLDRGEPR